jgi:hypothetical protein
MELVLFVERAMHITGDDGIPVLSMVMTVNNVSMMNQMPVVF